MTPEEEYAFLRQCTHDEVCSYLATKIRRARRQGKESQEVFARRVSVPLRTYKRFEAHGKASLETFIQILRAVGRAQYLLMLFPQPAPTTRPGSGEPFNCVVLTLRRKIPEIY